jgi:hypothetical protein
VIGSKALMVRSCLIKKLLYLQFIIGPRGEPGLAGLPGLPGAAGLRGLVSRIYIFYFQKKMNVFF